MNHFLPKRNIRKNLLLAPIPAVKWCFGAHNQNMRGLTLIEVMIVVVIIGILSSIAIPNYFSSREKAKMAATVAEIKILEKMITAYNIDNESYPDTL
jgi:prepilin-type N-terminal cleavage/methylation domain-containing protein